MELLYSIEKEFFDLEPYCTIDKDNRNAFSTKYIGLLLAICSEVDVIKSRIAQTINNTIETKDFTLDMFIPFINEKYSQIFSEEINVNSNCSYKYKPLESCLHGHSPNWWQAYNLVKHYRDEQVGGKENYKMANQENVIYALGALYLLVQFYAILLFVDSSDSNENYLLRSLRSKYISICNWSYLSFMGGSCWVDVKSMKSRFGLYFLM